MSLLLTTTAAWMLALAAAPPAAHATTPAPAAKPAAKPASPPAAKKPVDPNRWEKDMLRFEAADRASPPARGAVVFLGSSSIRMWKLAEWFPGRATINRGFGGSQAADCLRYAPRIVAPLRPSAVVFYAGDNDLGAMKTPAAIAADYARLLGELRAALPSARLVVLSVKPSPRRWPLEAQMVELNRLIEAIVRTHPAARFVDIHTPMLGNDGRPRAELFGPDGLHMNAEGYRLWTTLVTRALDE